MNTYTFTHDVPVSPSVVWGVVSDHVGMARWTPLRRAEMEAGGAPDPNGVGAVRALHLVGPPIREQITAFEPDRRLAYRALSGLPARDYTGEVTLEPAGSGTRIRWTIAFTPIVPGAQFPVSAAIRSAARALAKESTKRGAAAQS
ncbi:MAG TPA: SRPBCC family protein [Frankiaceae bacterium]|nr:SRPBCC family protein [Frankiaceae bacterium]